MPVEPAEPYLYPCIVLDNKMVLLSTIVTFRKRFEERSHPAFPEEFIKFNGIGYQVLPLFDDNQIFP